MLVCSRSLAASSPLCRCRSSRSNFAHRLPPPLPPKHTSPPTHTQHTPCTRTGLDDNAVQSPRNRSGRTASAESIEQQQGQSQDVGSSQPASANTSAILTSGHDRGSLSLPGPEFEGLPVVEDIV